MAYSQYLNEDRSPPTVPPTPSIDKALYDFNTARCIYDGTSSLDRRIDLVAHGKGP